VKRVTIFFWLTIACGCAVSPIVAIGTEAAKGTPFPAAVSEWIGRLFKPGYNEFLLTMIIALPFVAAGVLFLFHLAAERVPRGRWAGAGGALCAGAALSVWGLTAIRMSRSSTAAIGFLALPFEVAVAMLMGYLAGRLVDKLLPGARGQSDIA
jgi:hypothetical protein